MNTYESYVPYEAAKQMKALGFSELCHMTYDTTTLDREWQVHTGQHVLLSNKISCPTQVQAIDWFIQKYKLFIQVTYETIDGKSGYFCTIVEIGEFENGEPVCRVDSTCYDSRSQATNRGIDFAIGIVFERMSSVKFHPESMDEVFEILDKNISGDDKQYLLNNGALHCHHTLGRWIRNSFGLWEQILMPDVLGLTFNEAKMQLLDLGLRVSTPKEVYSNEVPAGNVISCQPDIGTPMQAGDAVLLTVSKGPEPITEKTVSFAVTLPSSATTILNMTVWMDGVQIESATKNIDPTLTTATTVTLSGVEDGVSVIVRLDGKDYQQWTVDFQSQQATLTRDYGYEVPIT